MAHQILQEIYDGILARNRALVKEKVQAALDAGFKPSAILNEGMIPAMAEVGRRFQVGDCYVPEMLVSARAMQDGLAILKPHLVEGEIKVEGKVVAGTVKGDLHDIGKTLVCMMLEGAGFEILDLGTDVSPEKFVEAVKTSSPNIVAMSALLTTTMPSMQATISALQKTDLRNKVKVIVGGAPLTEEYARRIGADGFAPDASRAVTLAKALMRPR